MQCENPATAAARIAKRLKANPNGVPVIVGLVNDQVSARDCGMNVRVCKSMPHEKVWIPGNCSEEGVVDILREVMSRVAGEVAEAMKAGKRAMRKPTGNHGWKR